MHTPLHPSPALPHGGTVPTRRGWLLLACLLPPLVGLGWRTAYDTPDGPCGPHNDAQVVVVTAQKVLHLCRGGASEAQFDVAIGRAGVGKQREGDGRTPLGTYPLAKARPSVSGLHRFLLIGYPTQAQRAQGLTGSAVGIHGPPRWAARTGLGLASWGATDGCVALGEDAEVDRVAAWVARHGVRRVTIL